MLWLGLSVLCWMKVMRVGIFVLYLILMGKFSAFHPWVWCQPWAFHRAILLCWGMFPLFPDGLAFLFFIFLNIFYLFIWEREWERESMRGGRVRGRSRLPAEQGAQCGTRSQDPGIMTWAKGSRLTNWATQAPQNNTTGCLRYHLNTYFKTNTVSLL